MVAQGLEAEDQAGIGEVNEEEEEEEVELGVECALLRNSERLLSAGAISN